MSLLKLFCHVDTFSMSEVMPSVISCHQLRFRDFKTYYLDYGLTPN